MKKTAVKKATREELFHAVMNSVAIIDDILQKNAKAIDAELAEITRKINL